MKTEEWKKIVKEKINNIADREMENECKKTKKMRNLEKEERKQKSISHNKAKMMQERFSRSEQIW